MKELLILGAVTCENVTYVEALPKGNEEIRPIRTEEKLGGSGARMASFLAGMNLPYVLSAVYGSGAYGEKAEELGEHLHLSYRSDAPAGSLLRMIDRSGKQSFVLVPGIEYTFHSETVEDLSNDELALAAVTGDYLCDENSDELLEWMSWLTCPIWFVPGMRLDEIEPETLESLYSLSPGILASAEDILFLSGQKDPIQGMKALHEKTGSDVAVLLGKDGAAALHDEEIYRTDEEAELESADAISTDEFAAAYLSALMGHVDRKNSLVFAKEAAARSLHNNHEMSDYDFRALKQRLAEMIMHG